MRVDNNNVRRRLAEVLVRYAAQLLPPGRSEWAAAMREEVLHISDANAAVRWAVGCVGAGIKERIRSMNPMTLRWFRWGASGWLALQALSGLFDGIFVLCYKFQYLFNYRLQRVGIMEFLGQRTEGDDYRRFVPLMNATGIWEPLVALLASALYLAAITQVLRRKAHAFSFFLGALALSIGPWLYSLSKAEVLQTFSLHHLVRDGVIYGLTAVLGVAIWRDANSRVSSSQ